MAEPSPNVIVIAGPNGAGKSTLAPFLLRDYWGIVEYVNADTLAMGLSAFQPEAVAVEAGRIMLKRLHELAEQRINFAFESTLAGRSYARWINRICQQGYSFHLVFLCLRSPEIAIQRVKERVRMGGHDVPEDIIRRRYRNGIRNFFEIYQPLAKTWAVYDNSDSTEPQLIAKTGDEKPPDIEWHDRNLWFWFCKQHE